MEKPAVSIISIFYNRENVVDESIRSLIDQDYENLEIILIDDNSTDSTYNKLLKFCEIDTRVRVIKNSKNKGFVTSLIDTISGIESGFIAIHGSGDISIRNRISEQMDVMVKFPDVGVVGCSVEMVGRRFNSSAESSWIFNQDQCYEDGRNRLLKKNYFTHGEVLFRRSYYEEVGGYRKQFKFSQDLDLWCRMSMISKFYIIDKVLYKRFLLSDGVSTDFGKAIVQQMLGDFARQCHEVRLKGEQDYIQRYGDQGLLFFVHTKRFCKKIYYLILKANSNGHDALSLTLIAKSLIKRSFNIYTFLIYLLIVLIPQRLVLKLGATYQLFKRKILRK